MTTTKKDLIDRIAVQTGQDRTAVKRTVQSFLNNVILDKNPDHLDNTFVVDAEGRLLKCYKDCGVASEAFGDLSGGETSAENLSKMA